MADEEMEVIPVDETMSPRAARTIFSAPRQHVTGFFEFVREHGIVGLAIGFMLGGAVQKVVTALVSDIINPFLEVLTGSAGRLEQFRIGPFRVGDFLSVFIDFLILAAVVYIVFKALRLDELDKKKQ